MDATCTPHSCEDSIKESEHTNTNLALVDLVGLGHGCIGVVTGTAATTTLAACIEWHVS
jgi:hypothetical protein